MAASWKAWLSQSSGDNVRPGVMPAVNRQTAERRSADAGQRSAESDEESLNSAYDRPASQISNSAHATATSISQAGQATDANHIEAYTEPYREIADAASEMGTLAGVNVKEGDVVKSGDVISNNTELIRDFDADGDATFERFNASKEEILSHTLQVIQTILTAWPENSLARDLHSIAVKLQTMGATYFMPTYPAPIIPISEYSTEMDISCPVCGWKGTPEEGEVNTDSDSVLDVSCPICEKMVLVAEYSAA